MSSSMIKKISNFFKRRKPVEEVNRKTKYPIVLETYGVVECLPLSIRPTVDTAYGTITYIYGDGTREVYYKG